MTTDRNPYQEVIRAVLMHHDLHRSAILLYLQTCAEGGSVRVSEAAKHLQMPRNTAVKAATDLVEAGLCSRKSGVLQINLAK